MNALVELESVLASKTPTALRAVIGLLSRVNAQVRSEVTLLSKTLPAVRAVVWPLSRVHALVSSEITRLSKVFPAVRALIQLDLLSRVNELVQLEIALTDKTLSTF